MALYSPDEEIKILQSQLQIAEQNVREWKRRYDHIYRSKPPATALVIDLQAQTLFDLTREATIRRQTPDHLAAKLLEHIVRDKLFAAVLDQ